MKRILLVYVVFGGMIGVVTAQGTGSRWWMAYTPDELKKIAVEYEDYLYPELQANQMGQLVSHKKSAKAIQLFRETKGHHDKLIKAHKHLRSRYEAEKNKSLKEELRSMSQWLMQNVENSHFTIWNRKLAEQLTKEDMDEFFWVQKVSKKGQTIKMLAEFGPRANHIYEPLRKWAIETDRYADVADALARIKTK